MIHQEFLTRRGKPFSHYRPSNLSESLRSTNAKIPTGVDKSLESDVANNIAGRSAS